MAESFGKVKFYSARMKYGFIETPNGDIFFHASIVKLCGLKALSRGDIVSYVCYVNSTRASKLSLVHPKHVPAVRKSSADAFEEHDHGIVKWYDNRKGYGFIQFRGQDYFVHHSGYQNARIQIFAGRNSCQFRHQIQWVTTSSTQRNASNFRSLILIYIPLCLCICVLQCPYLLWYCN